MKGSNEERECSIEKWKVGMKQDKKQKRKETREIKGKSKNESITERGEARKSNKNIMCQP